MPVKSCRRLTGFESVRAVGMAWWESARRDQWNIRLWII